MSKSNIEWTDETWNPVVGCRRVSPGCERCYAETMAGRLARMGQRRYLDVVRFPSTANGATRTRWNGTFCEVPEALAIPLHRKKPTTYFVNSMSDLFGEGVSDEWIAAVFGVMAACSQHRFQVLTKRADRLPRWFAWAAAKVDPGTGGPVGAVIDAAVRALPGTLHLNHWRPWPLPNVWIGVSVEDQQRADERIPHLLRVPAAVRFLSVEPMLGPISLHCAFCSDASAHAPRQWAMESWCAPTTERLHWVIVGGESGGGARPFDLAWARSIVEQCRTAGVAVFVKQLGARPVNTTCAIPGCVDIEHHPVYIRDRKGGDMEEWPEDLRVREFPKVAT